MPAPLIAGRYKAAPEDFEVEEIPSYVPSGDGTHTWLWVEKRGLSTMRAVEALAAAASVKPGQFGFAGMKDAQAVTRQWISVEHVPATAFRARSYADGDVRVLDVQQHGNKLKMGHLAGNRFSILIRDHGPDDEASLRANVDWCSAHGVPNHFGEQRFGKRGANLEQGLSILRSAKPKRHAYRLSPRVLKLVLSAVQSEVFNRVLNRRIDSYGRLLDGDLAWIHGKGASFTVQDLEAEQARCESFEISPSGPLPGPKTLWARGEAEVIEQDVLGEMDLDPKVFAAFKSHPGGRRSLRLPVRDALVEAEPEGLRVGFSLESGSFATSVLRQLMRDAPWPH